MGPLKIFAVVILCFKLCCAGNELGQRNDLMVDPYQEILRHFNLSTKHEFTVIVVEEVVHGFAAKIKCTEEVDNGQEDKIEGCPYNFCLNISSVLSSLGKQNETFITQDTFEEISLVLLEVAVSFNESCQTEVFLTKDSLTTYRNKVINRLSGGNVTTGLKMMPFHETLERIVIENGDSKHGEEIHSNENEAENSTQNEADDHSDEDADHRHIDLLKENCLGADTVFDELGLDLHNGASNDNAGKIAALVIYHILNGAYVSRDCRILPREDFFFEELDHIYGNGNNTLGKQGFSKVMQALQIGTVQSQTEEETLDVHDHRKKRSTGDAEMLYKSSWETKCYTDEELLAIFHAEDSDIPAEEFRVICPALIQQKLTGVCIQSQEDTRTQEEQPSKLDRYGYGSLATLIVCLCSVVGAFVVKVASYKAYEVIMALFLGLAVGTLFTDSMIHLLPTALGVHGNSEHDHSGDGLVVEEYIWYSLVSCAALYFFYLFEKSMVLIRGQHGHSHGLSDEDFHANEIQLSKSDKYNIESAESTKDTEPAPKRSGSIANIAVMVLMGDAVHNFADGLAIGASFSSSIALGLSTSIAVFCHELPHELGDFAVLLASGISFGRALMLNILVSATALIGLYVGLAVSDDESVQQWIVAVAAGLFIYIPLVDMMPKLLQKSRHGVRDFALNNIGILLGACAMLALAVFEEKIKVNLSH